MLHVSRAFLVLYSSNIGYLLFAMSTVLQLKWPGAVAMAVAIGTAKESTMSAAAVIQVRLNIIFNNC